VTLIRNEKNKSTSWLDKYNFLFFPDMGSLERGGEILNIVIPEMNSGNMLLGPRFEPYEYATYEYIGLFMNTDTINNAIRKHVYLQAKSGLSGSVAPKERPVSFMFHKDENTPLKLDKNLSDILKESGYRKVEDRLGMLDTETGMLTGSSVEYGNNIYFDTPTKKKIHFSEVAE
jgi:hypothetical protein